MMKDVDRALGVVLGAIFLIFVSGGIAYTVTENTSQGFLDMVGLMDTEGHSLDINSDGSLPIEGGSGGTANDTDPLYVESVHVDASPLTESDSAIYITTFEGVQQKFLEASGDIYSRHLWLDSSGGQIRNLAEIHLSNGGTVGSSTTYNNAFGVGPLELGGTLYAEGNTIQGVADPTSDSDAATKNYVDANTGSSGENFSVSTTHTSWSNGLDTEPIHRTVLQSGEELTIERIEFRGKNGVSDTAYIDVYDVTGDTIIGTASRGQTTVSPGTTGAGDTVQIRITNNTGNSVVGSIRVQGVVQ